MAAGLGFKDFTTGEVLTAADVDGYLMQGVWVFASAAARDAAVTSPQEGNFAYLKDTNVTTYYTGSAWANLDTTGMTNPMTTTGDTIYSSSGSTPARLGIGSTGQVLTVAGGVPTWAAPAGGSSGPAFFVNRATSTQSVSNNSATKVQFNTEVFDTDNCFDSTTNYRFTPTKAGYYQLNSAVQMSSGSMTIGEVFLRKNGSNFAGGNLMQKNNDGYVGIVVSSVMYLDGSTDYAEVFATAYGSAGTTDLNIGVVSNFSGVWIRS